MKWNWSNRKLKRATRHRVSFVTCCGELCKLLVPRVSLWRQTGVAMLTLGTTQMQGECQLAGHLSPTCCNSSLQGRCSPVGRLSVFFLSSCVCVLFYSTSFGSIDRLLTAACGLHKDPRQQKHVETLTGQLLGAILTISL
jgi:hypothetical protein